MVGLLDLPYDILLQVRSYLCFTNLSEALFSEFMKPEGLCSNARMQESNWRNFVNTTPAFKVLKKNTIIIFLKSLLTYGHSEVFRRRVDNLINDRSKQLHFHSGNNDIVHEESMYYFGNGSHGIHGVRWERAIDFSALANILYLNLDYCKGIKFVTNLNQLQTLRVKGCCDLKFIGDLPSLKRLQIICCRSLVHVVVPPLEIFEVRNGFLVSPEISISWSQVSHHLGIEFSQSEIKKEELKGMNHLESVLISRAKCTFEFNSKYFSNLVTLCLENCKSPIVGNLKNLRSLTIFGGENPIVFFESLPELREYNLIKCGMQSSVLAFEELSDDYQTYPKLSRVVISDCHSLQKIIIRRKIRSVSLSFQHAGLTIPEVEIEKPKLVQWLQIQGVHLKQKCIEV